MMNYLSADVFDFINESKLVSRFKNLKRFTQEFDLEFNEDAIDEIDANKIFTQLVKQPIEINVMQTFAVMGWHNTHWKTPYGQHAMLNWWLSVIEQDRKGNPLPRLIMVLRSILADTERYPAPNDVVQVMGQVLQELIQNGKLGHDQHIDVLQALVENQPKKLAKIALDQQSSVKKCMQNAKFPSKLPIVQEANLEWLSIWITEHKVQRQILRHALNQVLENNLDVAAKHRLAAVILNHSHFNIDKKALEKAVKDYPELVAWLSYCARSLDFKKGLSNSQRQTLSIWIGTGNYESLKSILTDIAWTTADNSDVEKTSNRYIFWKNYQQFFQEAWLLLPETLYKAHQSQLPNIKKVQGTEYPIVVLKIQDYFVFQYFLGSAAKNDLLMTDDVDQVESILNQTDIFNDELRSVNLVLIHDHFFKWQSDLAYTLDENFQLPAVDKKVHITHTFVANYQQEIGKPEFIETRKEWKNLPNWVKNHLKRNYPPSVYQTAALTVKRYGLLD